MQGEGRRQKLLDGHEQGVVSLAGLKKAEGRAAASAAMAGRMRAGPMRKQARMANCTSSTVVAVPSRETDTQRQARTCNAETDKTEAGDRGSTTRLSVRRDNGGSGTMTKLEDAARH